MELSEGVFLLNLIYFRCTINRIYVKQENLNEHFEKFPISNLFVQIQI